MIKQIREGSWQRLMPWVQDTDTKVRTWVTERGEQILKNVRIPSRQLASVMEPLRGMDAGVSFDEFQGQFEQLTFRTKAKVGETVFRSFAHLARQWLGAQVHEVELSAGKVRYWKTTHARPETVLFFHGFGDSMNGVYPLAFHLVARFNLIVPDLPGFGSSFKRPDLCHNYQSYGVWLDEFVRAAEIGPVHVVGNSLGGAFALMLAQLRPDLVKSITLLNSAAITDFKNNSIYDEFLQGQIMFQVKTQEEFEHFWQRVFHKKPFIPPFVKEYMLHQFRENHDWYGHLIKEIFSDIQHKRDPRYKEVFMNHHLSRMKVPALIIWGDQDRLFPVSFGQRGHKLLRNSKFVVLENVGHAPQVEAPRLVAKHLRDFIDQVCKV